MQRLLLSSHIILVPNKRNIRERGTERKRGGERSSRACSIRQTHFCDGHTTTDGEQPGALQILSSCTCMPSKIWGSEMPSSRPILNKVCVERWFHSSYVLAQTDHLNPVKGESEGLRRRNRTHINTLAFHHLRKACQQLSANHASIIGCWRLTCLKLGRMKRREIRSFEIAYIKIWWCGSCRDALTETVQLQDYFLQSTGVLYNHWTSHEFNCMSSPDCSEA
jgi:hypothetical protein